MTITVRGSRIAYVNNASSGSITLPSGSAANDLCLVFAEHGWGATAPTGWTQIDNQTGTNVNGAAFMKVLTSADITAGSVSVSFAGTYYGILAAISFVGTLAGYRTFVSQRNSSGATSRTLTTNSSPVSTDYAVYFGSGRGNVTITSSGGTALQTSSNANASGVLAGNLLGSAGAVSSTFTFSAAPTGDYEIIVIIAETATSSARVSWIGLESLEVGQALGRVSWYGAEVLHGSVVSGRLSWIGVEVLRTISAAAARSPRRTVLILW